MHLYGKISRRKSIGAALLETTLAIGVGAALILPIYGQFSLLDSLLLSDTHVLDRDKAISESLESMWGCATPGQCAAALLFHLIHHGQENQSLTVSEACELRWEPMATTNSFGEESDKIDISTSLTLLENAQTETGNDTTASSLIIPIPGCA